MLKKILFLSLIISNVFCSEKSDDNIYPYLPHTYVINPIFDPKRSYCSKRKFNENDLYIRIDLYQPSTKSRNAMNVPLSLFRNKDGSFVKKGEKVVYQYPFYETATFTIDAEFEEMIYLCYQSFVLEQNESSNCIIL